MRNLKLYEAHYTDVKMESDIKDIFIELKDIGMSVRAQSPDSFGYSFVIIRQKYIPELDGLTYSEKQVKFLDKETNFNSLIEIDKPLFESIFEMFIDYMEKKGRHLFRISYKEPFNQTVIKNIFDFVIIKSKFNINSNFEILRHIISDKKLESIDIYFKEEKTYYK
jgi:hypothetical protein